MLPTMTKPLAGICALLANVLVTGIVYAILKKNVTEEDELAVANVEDEEDIDFDDIEIL